MQFSYQPVFYYLLRYYHYRHANAREYEKAGSGLEKVVLPEGVTTLGFEAFAWCENLKSVTLPTTITDFGDDEEKKIYAETFFKCEALTEIVLPEGITKLGSSMFGSCKALKKVTLPSTLTVIPKYLFTNCSNLGEVTLHSTLTKIDCGGFLNCKLDDIYFDGTVEQWQAVLDKTKESEHLTNVFGFNSCYLVTCTDGYYIDTDTGYNMQQNDGTKNGDVSVYNGISSDNDAWSKIVIPHYGTFEDGTECYWTATCEGTFLGNKYITSIAIPSEINVLGKSAFACCENLSRILYDGTRAEWSNVQKGDNWNYGMGEYTVYCTDGTVQEVAASDFVPSQGLTINADLTLTGIGSCQDKVLYIVKGTKAIGREAFRDNTNIIGVIIPDSVEKIDDYAFQGCSSIKYVDFGEGLKTIGRDAFAILSTATSSLKSITLPASLKTIGARAFLNHPIDDIYFGGTMTQWNENVNKGDSWDSGRKGYIVHCSDGRIFDASRVSESLTYELNDDGLYTVTGRKPAEENIFIPSTHSGQFVSEIANNAFSYCSIDVVFIPSTITYIGEKAFERCVVYDQFCYNGTVEQWNAIEKADNWAANSAEFTVYCIDGEVVVK